MTKTPKVDALIRRHIEESQRVVALGGQAPNGHALRQVEELIALARDLEQTARPESAPRTTLHTCPSCGYPHDPELGARPEEPLVHYSGDNGSGLVEQHTVSVKEAGELLTDALAVCNRIIGAASGMNSRPERLHSGERDGVFDDYQGPDKPSSPPQNDDPR